MSADAIEQPRQAAETEARLRLARGPLARPVLCRVVSMALTRAGWPIDRLDEAMLACDALCAHAPAYALNGRLTFNVRADEREMELRVLDLAPEGAAALVHDARLPGVGNVLERIADSLSIEPADEGERSELVLLIGAS